MEEKGKRIKVLILLKTTCVYYTNPMPLCMIMVKLKRKGVFMKNKLYVGAARTCITPDETLTPHLQGLMGMRFGGTFDELYLRVIALAQGEQKALLVSFDLDKAPTPEANLQALSEATGVSAENILYIGTHTHAGPIVTERQREMSRETDEQKTARVQYEDLLREKLLETARQALENLAPARMGYGEGKCYINVGRNQLFEYEHEDGKIYHYPSQAPDFSREIDHTVALIRFEGEDGKPLAFFINYPLHNCVTFLNRFCGETSGYCSDVGGNVSRLMEEKFPGTVAVWSSGAAGDINPLMLNGVFYPDPMNGSCKMDAYMDSRTLKLLLDQFTGWHMDAVLRINRRLTCTEDSAELAGLVDWSVTPGRSVVQLPMQPPKVVGEEDYRIRLHLLKIGNVALFGLGGELYNDFGVMLKDEAPMKTIIVNHDASLIDDAGYIADDDTLEKVQLPCPVHGMVPGVGPRIVPGHVGASLKAHMKDMFVRVEG